MKELEYERHDLVYLTEEGKRQAWKYISQEDRWRFGENILRQAVELCPGIMCRQEKREEGLIKLGFSWYQRQEGIHIRFASKIKMGEILRIEKPWDLIGLGKKLKNEKINGVLEPIAKTAGQLGVRLGVFGSCAMETATGLPYTDQYSDLDLLVQWGETRNLEAFWKECRRLAGNTLVDLEIRFPGVGDVKAAEWFSEVSDLLVKRLCGPALISRNKMKEQ